MPSRTAALKPLVAVVVVAAALGACTTSADFSYSENRAGPGFETERVYENRVYGDTGAGLGAESCRVVVRRQVNVFGEVSAREETVCDEF